MLWAHPVMTVTSQDWVFWSQDQVPNCPGHSIGCQKACCRSMGAPILMLQAHAAARTMCSCKKFSLDPQVDHVLICKKHTGATGVDGSVGVDVDAVVGVGVHGQGVNLGVGLGVGLVVGSPPLDSLDS